MFSFLNWACYCMCPFSTEPWLSRDLYYWFWPLLCAACFSHTFYLAGHLQQSWRDRHYTTKNHDTHFFTDATYVSLTWRLKLSDLHLAVGIKISNTIDSLNLLSEKTKAVSFAMLTIAINGKSTISLSVAFVGGKLFFL